MHHHLVAPKTYQALIKLGIPTDDANSLASDLFDEYKREDQNTDELTTSLVVDWTESAKAPPDAFQPKGSPQAALRTVLSFRRPRAVVQLAVWAREERMKTEIAEGRRYMRERR